MRPFLIFLLLFASTNLSSSWELWESAKDYVLGERCVDRWLPGDIRGLQIDLRRQLFGQPFVEQALLPLLKRHLGSSVTPQKALALSFHGSPGVGKTYVTGLIAKYLYKNGDKSQFYKFITMSASYDLSKNAIRNLIINTVKQCDRAMFVFDEIEKMPDGIIEVVKSFLDFHPQVGNVDYRKSIFIFISNIGQKIINDISLDLWKRGIQRNDFDITTYEKALFTPTYNEKGINQFVHQNLECYRTVIKGAGKGGLKKTTIVRNYLIDMYLPFLPLEKEHVVSCIHLEAAKMKYTVRERNIGKILNGLEFLPDPEEVFSYSGCKNIHSLIVRYGETKDEAHDEF